MNMEYHQRYHANALNTNVLVELYDEYEELISSTKYEISGYRVLTLEANPEEVRKIESEGDGSCIDRRHRYLVLYLANGETATFCNCHTTLIFREGHGSMKPFEEV